MDVEKAQKIARAISGEWLVLSSLLTAAVDGEVAVALGYASTAEWLAELIPDRTLPGLGPVAPTGSLTGPRPARVSQPGRRESTTRHMHRW